MLRVEAGSAKGARLVAWRAYREGEVLGRLEGFRDVAAPTYLSVQVGPERHIEGIGQFDYLNHSCAPTAILDTTNLEVRAARDLAPGDEVTFFYPSTEWSMAQPFQCLCGAPECLGTIAGARDLPRETLARYSLNAHILALLAESDSRPSTQGDR